MPDSTITLRTRSDLAGVQSLSRAYTGLVASEQAALRSTQALGAAFARQRTIALPSLQLGPLRAQIGQAEALLTAFQRSTERPGARTIAPPTLDVGRFRAQVVTVEGLLDQLSRKQVRPIQIPGAANLQNLDNAFRALTTSEQRLVQENLSLAQSYGRLQAAQGQAGQGASFLRAQLNSLSAAPAKSVLAIQSQIAQLDRAARGSVGGIQSLGGAFRTLQVGAGALGIGLAASQIVQFGSESLSAANALDKTVSTVRALSGSQERYNEVLRTARTGQQNFGGSLEENLRGLGSLVNLSNRSGASLAQLDNVARRLAVIDPLQGIEGANIALKEFLTGSDATAIQSLVRRFELPKSALKAFTDESLNAAQRLAALDQVLSEQGITQEVLTNRTNTTAAAYDRLGAAAEQAKLRIGSGLAEALRPVAVALTNTLTITERYKQAQAEALASAQSFAEFQQNLGQQEVALSRQESRGRGGGRAQQQRIELEGLTEAQFDYARALAQTGTHAEEALARAQELAPTFERIAEVQTRFASSGAPAALDELSRSMLAVAASGAEGAAFVDGLNQAIHKLGIGQAQAALDAFSAGQRATAAAAREAALEQEKFASALARSLPIIDQEAAALQKAADEALNAKVKSAELTAVQETLASVGTAVRDGLITSGQGAAILAQALQLPIDKARELLALQGQIAGVGDKIAAATRAIARQTVTGVGKKDIDVFGLPTEKDVQKSERIIADANSASEVVRERNAAAARDAAQLEQARVNRILRTGTALEIVSVRQQQYTDAVKRFGANSAQAIDAQTDLIDAQQAASKARAGGGGLAASERADLALSQAGLEGATRLQARLDEVNKKLESARLTEVQRKQLAAEKLELERKIADEIGKQADAALDAQILAIKDRQERRQEQRELEGARRRLASGEFSEEEKAGAADVAALIPLEQEKRRREIEQKARAGGLDIAAAAPVAVPVAAPIQVPIPTLPAQAPQVPQAGAAATLILQLDSKQVGSILIPDLIAALKSGLMPVAAAGG